MIRTLTMELRPYQQEAIETVYQYLREHDDNPVIVIPTAGGKTPILATICRDAVMRWNGRVLILAHVKELLEQASDKLRTICPEVKFGVYSAGLNRRDTEHAVIVAGIQSVYRRACELDAFDLIIVDEAHLIPRSGDGMYRQFLSDAKIVNPDIRIIGMTATPFRLDSGTICEPDYFLNRICYRIGVGELIRDGYLCPLITKGGKTKVDTNGLHIRAGEFIANEVESLMNQDSIVESACREIVELTHDRQAVLIFAAGVAHGRHIVNVLQNNHDIECGFVCGETPGSERHQILARFRRASSILLPPLKYLCNVNVLTTGFDAPMIDCIALLRPTASTGLYYQSVGRGFRLHPGKQNCLILDYAGNVLRHGPIDQIDIPERKKSTLGKPPVKECPECGSFIATGYACCPDCGYEFPPSLCNSHDGKAGEDPILSDQTITTTVHRVQDVFYAVHTKRGADDNAPKTFRVDYKIGWHNYQSEWICVEHVGYAREKAVAWWRKRSNDPVPATARRAVEIAESGGLALTKSITVRSVDGEYDRIVDYELESAPAPIADTSLLNATMSAEDDIPF